MQEYKSVKPLNERILVEAIENQAESGGVILPNKDDLPTIGKVIAVGRGRLNEQGKIIPSEVSVGDIIMFGKYSGTKIEVNGKEYQLMKESDIQLLLLPE